MIRIIMFPILLAMLIICIYLALPLILVGVIVFQLKKLFSKKKVFSTEKILEKNLKNGSEVDNMRIIENNKKKFLNDDGTFKEKNVG